MVAPSVITEGPELNQVVTVVQLEPGATMENQQVDNHQPVKFTWTIPNFLKSDVEKEYSDIFIVGGYKWRILICRRRNRAGQLALFLDAADAKELPIGCSRYAQFTLAVVNQVDGEKSIKREDRHQFSACENDRGFIMFMPLAELYDPDRGYILNGTIVVEAEILVGKLMDYHSYDSKKETGYIGLKNQGATCYMNSLLQTLYHIPYFRKAVYHMPTTENDTPTGSIPLALQRLFYRLQYNDTSVSTKELTKSFGWGSCDSFLQHDVQELNRVLCENLESKMKGTVVEDTIKQLFEGHHMNYIQCMNVEYKSTRKESFYDIQLDIKGCRDVYASFDKYVEVEHLEGDNKYHAADHGLQDAKKGVLFINFPPVLQLQLKRFEYDFTQDTMAKINDRYEFPLQLDLDRESGKYLSPNADPSVRNLYTLYSVLVHLGGVSGGHYCAFIRPTLSDQWLKFDDERVTKEDAKQALEEQYGGEEDINPRFNDTTFKITRNSNAYMLVYIRESDKEKINCTVEEEDIAEHLRIRLKKEQEEKEDRKRYKTQAHLYMMIRVARDEDFREQIGRDVYFDLVDHEKVRSFRVQKQTSFIQFKEEVSKEFRIPAQNLRFWIWGRRQNNTYRPCRPLTRLEEAQNVECLREITEMIAELITDMVAELKLYMEVKFVLDLRPIIPSDKTVQDILIFVKHYDPEKEELRYIGRLYVKSTSKPIEVLFKFNQMAGFAPDEEIDIYEELSFDPVVKCKHINKGISFEASEIINGDIICFHKSFPSKCEPKLRYPDVPSFLEYVRNCQMIHFRSLDKPTEDKFSLILSKLSSYDDVVERVAKHIGLDDPSKIRLTFHDCYTQKPMPHYIRYRSIERLSNMLSYFYQRTEIIYYEVLDIPLPELEGLKTLKISFRHATKEEVTVHSIRLSKESVVLDLINELKTKVELSHLSAELRLLEIHGHRIYKIIPLSENIQNMTDHFISLLAEEIPEEEKNIGPQDHLIHVCHFSKDAQWTRYFGIPFCMVICENETLAQIKVRIQKKLQVPDEEFLKWKFACTSVGPPEYLLESDVLLRRSERNASRRVYQLGLDHSDNAPKRISAINQNCHTYDKAIKINN